jgi:hypothetical protein
VLQHIAPAATLRYLREFFRVLSRDGVLVFLLPSHPRRVQDAPPQSRPMPNAAYRAAIHLENGTLDGAAPGTKVLLTLSVTNLSGESWSQNDVGPLRLGNHWLAGDGSAMLIQDDGRTPLPEEVAAGATCRVQLMVTTPREPGIYELQCDVVHEGVTWFADRGSRPWSRVVPTGDVPWAQPVAFAEPGTAGHSSERTLGLTAEPPAVDPGPLPMHGIHRAVVEQAVRDFGGGVLHVEADERCGKEWVGFRYFARKL